MNKQFIAFHGSMCWRYGPCIRFRRRWSNSVNNVIVLRYDQCIRFRRRLLNCVNNVIVLIFIQTIKKILSWKSQLQVKWLKTFTASTVSTFTQQMSVSLGIVDWPFGQCTPNWNQLALYDPYRYVTIILGMNWRDNFNV